MWNRFFFCFVAYLYLSLQLSDCVEIWWEIFFCLVIFPCLFVWLDARTIQFLAESLQKLSVYIDGHCHDLHFYFLLAIFSSLKSFNFVSIANWHWHWWREEKSIKTDCHVKSILDGLFFCQKAHSTKHWRLFELDFSLLKVRFFPGKLHHVTLIFRYFWSLLTHTILLMYSCSCGGSGCSGQVFSQLLFFEVIYISQ